MIRPGFFRLCTPEAVYYPCAMPTDRNPCLKPDREARLKAALRDNLRKRKQRDRATITEDGQPETTPPSGELA